MKPHAPSRELTTKVRADHLPQLGPDRVPAYQPLPLPRVNELDLWIVYPYRLVPGPVTCAQRRPGLLPQLSDRSFIAARAPRGSRQCENWSSQQGVESYTKQHSHDA